MAICSFVWRGRPRPRLPSLRRDVACYVSLPDCAEYERIKGEMSSCTYGAAGFKCPRRICMKWTDLFLAQLADEAPRTRRTLEHVPSGRDDWKPHEKSMAFGNLARLVATMPTWFPMIINMDQLDIGGGAGG